MTEITRRAVLGGLSAFATTPAFSQTAWPTRPITLLIGFPAGGPPRCCIAHHRSGTVEAPWSAGCGGK
jgi:hypothetical protein